MNSILQFFATFCAAAIFIGALYIICPEGAVSKTVKYTLSLVFMCITVAAAGFTVKTTQIEAVKPHTFSENQLEMEVLFARQVYARALTSQKIKFDYIEVFTNKLQNGSIVINKVEIKTDAQSQQVIAALQGLDPSIEVEIINE